MILGDKGSHAPPDGVLSQTKEGGAAALLRGRTAAPSRHLASLDLRENAMEKRRCVVWQATRLLASPANDAI